MKTLLSILLTFALAISAYGQDEQLSKKELKKFQKEQKRAEQQAQMELAMMITEQMITTQKFVLEADYLSDKTGNRVPVQAMINFVLCDSTEGTIQLGSAEGAGYNGVGGATIDGRIDRYKFAKIGKKQDSFSVSFGFNSSMGLYDITLMVNAPGDADITIRGNFGGNLNYHGKLVPLSQSRIYKGTSTF